MAAFLAVVLIWTGAVPGASQAAAPVIQAINSPVASWPASFTPYADRQGNVFYDPANEPGISPDDVDFQSGVSKGSGDKPSFYAAGDGSNLFFRIRLLGDPSDSKGGFLSSVWMVQVLQNGVPRATIGLDGKSPHEDYIYVSNATGSVIHYINKTDSSGSKVPGTRVTEDTNADYFLDIQVPVSALTDIDSNIKSSSILQFNFATSKAANLAVINKDGMQGAGAYAVMSPAFAMYRPTIAITGLGETATTFPASISGTTTSARDQSSVAVTINSVTQSGISKTYNTVVNQGSWTISGISGLPAEDSYLVTAKVTNENQDTAQASQKIAIFSDLSNVTINGKEDYSTYQFPSSFGGDYIRSTGGARKVDLNIYQLSNSTPPVQTSVFTKTGIVVSGNPGSWNSGTLTYPSGLTAGKTYQIVAVAANNAQILDTQTIHYLSSNLAITSPANSTRGTATPVITGKANPGEKVKLTIDNAAYQEIQAGSDGNWSLTIDRPLPPNASTTTYHVIKASVVDEAGNTQTTGALNYGVDDVSVSIENGSHAYTYYTNVNPVLRGRSTDTSVNLKITNDQDPTDNRTFNAVPVSNGKWTLAVPSGHPLLDPAAYTVVVTAGSNASKQAVLKLRVKTKTNIAIQRPASGGSASVQANVYGTTEPNASVNLVIDNTIVTDVTADSAGLWSYTPTSPWSQTSHTVRAVTADEAGNSAEDVTLFQVGRPLPVHAVGSINGEGTVTVSGAEPFASLILYSPGRQPISNGIADQTGHYTFVGVPFDQKYTVTQTVDSLESDFSNAVDVEATVIISPNAPDPVTATGDVYDGEGMINVTGAVYRAQLQLYNAENVVIANGTAEENGKYTFRHVPSAAGYTVTQTVDQLESRHSNIVNIGSTPPVQTAPDPVIATGSINDARTVSVSGAQPSASLKLYREGMLIDNGRADPAGMYTFTSVPIADHYYVIQIVEEIASNPSNKVNVEAEPEAIQAVLKLSANPARILADGKATTQLTAVLTDLDGKAIAGVPVGFRSLSNVGTLLKDGQPLQNGEKIVTDNTGKAVVTYRSAATETDQEMQYIVQAAANDPDRGLEAQDQIMIAFQPPAISGIVTRGTGNVRVNGATVKASLDLNGNGVMEPGIDFIKSVVTGADGSYNITVPRADQQYALEITEMMDIGGVSTPIKYNQKAIVGSVKGDNQQNFNSEKTVTGVLLMKKPDGSTGILQDSFLNKTKAYLMNKATGTYIADSSGHPKAFAMQDNGVFSAEGLENGSYTLDIRYDLGSGQEITVTQSSVQVTADGEMNISQELVDPYGTVTDQNTGALIPGATVTLYYAKTDRNGSKADTKVSLPAIPGFEPNNNASPIQLTDAKGFYAYMVYPYTDYYLLVHKDGYADYRSETISVETEIVRKDIQLAPLVSSSGGHSGGGTSVSVVSGTPHVRVSVTADKTQVEEGSVSTLTVDYQNDGTASLTSGTVNLKLPVGTEVIAADGGAINTTTEAVMVGWPLSQVKTGQSGKFTIQVKWPQAHAANENMVVAASVTSGSSAEETADQLSSVMIRVFSQRYDHLGHKRYMQGYPDRNFYPNRSLTRAELAAMVARLTEDAGTATRAGFKDVPVGYWAADYIDIAVNEGYFQKGTYFRPDEPVTRSELAAVVTRFKQLPISPLSTYHFNDIKDHWAASAIEQLYQNQWIKGYPDGAFRPNAKISRVEAATMMNVMLNRGPLRNREAMFPDVQQGYWGFGNIQEAAISHESIINAEGSEDWIQDLSQEMR
ncbi:hypothetical protein AR543_14825 [Paenibacillus bovis]|uniref:Uncharacterized protein n=1 Tax=Paenibacillus bovis TaxID=1616788 RepID=A0A172ZHT2_9BACL|nr:hypothetical protein AR543_14825 [Paenibacillus bovis]